MLRINSTKIAVLGVRSESEQITARLGDALGAVVCAPYSGGVKPAEYFREHFKDYGGWVLVMSTGIAVRFLDGIIQDKYQDPAVVVLDEGCHHAIALLSGHEGGANELAYKVANVVHATPVISTATESLKEFVVGVGCRKDVSGERIATAVLSALGDRPLSQVRCVATVAAKANEPGLLQFCSDNNLPLRVFAHEDVAQRHWTTKPSEWVRQNLGLDGVCEPCALMATARGKLVVPKTTLDGVAVAVVEDSVNLVE